MLNILRSLSERKKKIGEMSYAVWGVQVPNKSQINLETHEGHPLDPQNPSYVSDKTKEITKIITLTHYPRKGTNAEKISETEYAETHTLKNPIDAKFFTDSKPNQGLAYRNAHILAATQKKLNDFETPKYTPPQKPDKKEPQKPSAKKNQPQTPIKENPMQNNQKNNSIQPKTENQNKPNLEPEDDKKFPKNPTDE